MGAQTCVCVYPTIFIQNSSMLLTTFSVLFLYLTIYLRNCSILVHMALSNFVFE